MSTHNISRASKTEHTAPWGLLTPVSAVCKEKFPGRKPYLLLDPVPSPSLELVNLPLGKDIKPGSLCLFITAS